LVAAGGWNARADLTLLRKFAGAPEGGKRPSAALTFAGNALYGVAASPAGTMMGALPSRWPSFPSRPGWG